MLKFLIKGVFRDRHHYLFPLIMVGAGVTMMVFMLSFMNGYTQSFIRQNAGFDTGHLKVVTRAYSEMPELKPYDLGLLDIGPQLELWKREYPQLDWVERIPFGALMDVPDANGETREQGNVAGFGVDLFSSPLERRFMNLDKALVQGRFPRRSMELLLSDKAFRRLGLKLGDPVTLICSDIHGGMVFRNFSVCGTIDFGMEAFDRGAVIADLADVRQAGGFQGADDGGVRGLAVGVDAQGEVGPAGRRLAQAFGQGGVVRRVDVVAVERVQAVAADRQFEEGRGVRRLGLGLGQRDLQLAVAGERGGGRQEDQDHQQHVDQRNQVDLGLVVGAAVVEVHVAARRLIRRFRVSASRSMVCRKYSTRERK